MDVCKKHLVRSSKSDQCNDNTSFAMDRVNVNASLSVSQSASLSLPLSSDEGLLSTLPSWCSFEGMIRCCTDN